MKARHCENCTSQNMIVGALRNLLFQAHAELEAVDESLSFMLPAQVIHGVNRNRAGQSQLRHEEQAV